METHDQSCVFDPSSAEWRKSDKKSETLRTSYSVLDLQVTSRSPLKIEEEKTECELQACAASCLSGEAPTAPEDMTPVGDKAAASMQKDCEGSEEAPVVLDHHGEPGMDLLLTQQQGEAPHPPQEQTPTEDGNRISEKNKQRAFQLVLHELLQQQKHKPGRRFKKKTLMKMAKLLVITRGWDGEASHPVRIQDAPGTSEGSLLPDDIIETHKQSGAFDPSSVERLESDKDEKLHARGGSFLVPDLQLASRSALKMGEEETECELQACAASCLSGEAPTAPEDMTPTEDGNRISEKNKQRAFQLVLHELLQQQKHKPGRRFKKKTLMKMAKLLVITRGCDGEASHPVRIQDAPGTSGEDGSAETTVASNQQELNRKQLENQQEDVNLCQQAHGASRTRPASDQQNWSTSLRSNREEGVMTQIGEEMNPGTFRVLEAHQPRKKMKKASRTRKNKKAEQKPPEETSAEQQVRHHGVQSAFSLQTEEEVASPEQNEGLSGHAGIVRMEELHGKKRRNITKTNGAQTKPEAETLGARRQNLQELLPGGAVLQGQTVVKFISPKPRKCTADKAVPPPKGVLRDLSPAGSSEQIHVERTAAKTGKPKNHKRRAELEFSALESFPEKNRDDVWFGSFNVKQEQEEQPIEPIRKRKGKKRKEERTKNELQNLEPPTKMMDAAVPAEEGQPKPAVQGETKRRGRKKIKPELIEKRSKDISDMAGAAVEKTPEEHLKTLEDPNSKTGSSEMKKRWKKRKNSAADFNLILPGPSSTPDDVSETLKEKTRKMLPDSEAPLGLGSSPLNLRLPEDSVVKRKKRGRRPKAKSFEATSQIPQTGSSLESKDSNVNRKPPENLIKQGRKSKAENVSSPENTQILELKAVKQEFDGSETSEPLCQTEEWAPPRRKPRRRKWSCGVIRTVRRRMKSPQTLRNLVPVDLSETERKTVQLSGLGESASLAINSAPKDQELPHQTLSSKGQSHLCSVCGRSFRHLSVLTQHRLIHTESKPPPRPPRKKRTLEPPHLSCPCCAAVFNNNTKLLLHLSHAESCTTQPEGRGRPPIHSDITSFAGHLPISGRRRHSCPTCWKTFRSPAGLRLHLKIHTRICVSTECFQDPDLHFPPETQSGPPETQSGPPETQSGPPETQSGAPETQSVPPETQSVPPETQSGAPETQSGAPETQSVAPETQSVPPETQSVPPETQSGAPETQSGPPETQSVAPETQSVPPETQSGAPETQSVPPETQSGPPETQSGAPETQSGPPETQSGPPETQSGAPETQSGPPETQSGSPETKSGPPETKSGPPETQSGPPETQSGPPETQSGPSERSHTEPNAETVTSVLFSCPTCRKLHPHWCRFVLHVRTHAPGWCRRCDVCSQQRPQDEEPPQHCSACCELSGEAETCRRLLSGSWKEAGPVRGDSEEERTREGWEFSSGGAHGGLDKGVDAQLPSSSPSNSSPLKQVEVSNMSPMSNQGVRQPVFLSQPIIPRRFVCARWGRSIPHRSRLGMHQHSHRKPGKAFHCNHCQLDFHFQSSYLLHLQEHAAQTPHACAACPATFAEERQLCSHVSECHGQRRCRRCSRCGKPFSSQVNLQKHELLHRGVRLHACTPCQLSFSCSADLTAHLNAHGARLRAPEPARLLEPLYFPYPCRKCDVTFSSADLLQAHQVCHLTAGKRPESPAPYFTRSAPEGPQRGTLEPARPLPVSNRKHLFRYPHPDRLYVVPAPSSEPALLISDSEDEIRTSVEPRPSLQKPAAPQPTEVSEMDQLDLLIQSLIPEGDFSESNSCCESKAPPPVVSPQEGDVHTCAICTAAFTELSGLHAHYMDHARIL